MSGCIVVSEWGAVRTIAMLHPENMNALTGDMCLGISKAIETAQRDPAICCLVVAGRFGVFKAGSDIRDHPLEPGAPRSPDVRRLLQALARNAKPIVAAVDGLAAGIGTTMAFHCDHVVAGATATFASPVLPPDPVPYGAMSTLAPRLLGHQRAFAMLVLGRPMSAQDARDAGLVDVIVPPGQAILEAERIAQQICRSPTESVALARRVLKPPKQDVLQRMEEEDRWTMRLS